MAFYRQLGSIPPKRHTQHRRPDGELYYEELTGEEVLPDFRCRVADLFTVPGEEGSGAEAGPGAKAPKPRGESPARRPRRPGKGRG